MLTRAFTRPRSIFVSKSPGSQSDAVPSVIVLSEIMRRMLRPDGRTFRKIVRFITVIVWNMLFHTKLNLSVPVIVCFVSSHRAVNTTILNTRLGNYDVTNFFAIIVYFNSDEGRLTKPTSIELYIKNLAKKTGGNHSRYTKKHSRNWIDPGPRRSHNDVRLVLNSKLYFNI